MSTNVVSENKRVESDIASVFAFFSNGNRLAEVISGMEQALRQGNVPGVPENVQSRINGMKSTDDSCSFQVENMGEIGLRIDERQEPSLVKIKGEGTLPFPIALEVRLTPRAPYETEMQIALDAEMNMMMKFALKSKLQQMIDQLAGGLAKLPFTAMNARAKH
jgi:carbon monoxide dehydrogenase subunit G